MEKYSPYSHKKAAKTIITKTQTHLEKQACFKLLII